MECSTYLRPHINVSCQSCCIHHFSFLQPFSRSLQSITPLHISLSMSLSLRPFSTSLNQMIHYLTINFYPLILYIWGPYTLSGLPSVRPLLTTSHNCFNPILRTVKSNNNNNNNNNLCL